MTIIFLFSRHLRGTTQPQGRLYATKSNTIITEKDSISKSLKCRAQLSHLRVVRHLISIQQKRVFCRRHMRHFRAMRKSALISICLQSTWRPPILTMINSKPSSKSSTRWAWMPTQWTHNSMAICTLSEGDEQRPVHRHRLKCRWICSGNKVYFHRFSEGSRQRSSIIN